MPIMTFSKYFANNDRVFVELCASFIGIVLNISRVFNVLWTNKTIINTFVLTSVLFISMKLCSNVAIRNTHTHTHIYIHIKNNVMYIMDLFNSHHIHCCNSSFSFFHGKVRWEKIAFDISEIQHILNKDWHLNFCGPQIRLFFIFKGPDGIIINMHSK